MEGTMPADHDHHDHPRAVEARFYVAEVTRRAWGGAPWSVKLQAVSRGPENKVWASATPSGTVTLEISNEAAARWFDDRLGKGDVAITFTDAPDVPPGS
jgi:hypothetical protein